MDETSSEGKSKLFYLTVAGNILNLLILIVAFSTTGWVVISVNRTDISYGLWKICSSIGFGTTCISIPGSVQPDWYKGMQAMMCLALLAHFAATGAIVVRLAYSCLKMNRRTTMIVHTVFIAAAGICCLIGVILFGTEWNSPEHLHYSFGLAIVSSILAFILTGMSCVQAMAETA